MLLVTLSAFLPWFGEQGSAADLQWQPGGLEASDRSAAWWGWQTGRLSGPVSPPLL